MSSRESEPDAQSPRRTQGAGAGRMYDYYLGGNSHSATDEESARNAIQSFAAVETLARENRAFLLRAVRHLAEDAGVHQFLTHPKVLELIDFDRPIALLLVAVLHFFPDEYEPGSIVRTLVNALPAGSHVVSSHVTPEHDPEGVARLVEAYRAAGVPEQARTAEELAHLVFDDLDLIHPGLVAVSHWWPEGSDPRPGPAAVSLYGGVGRKD